MLNIMIILIILKSHMNHDEISAKTIIASVELTHSVQSPQGLSLLLYDNCSSGSSARS